MFRVFQSPIFYQQKNIYKQSDCPAVKIFTNSKIIFYSFYLLSRTIKLQWQFITKLQCNDVPCYRIINIKSYYTVSLLETTLAESRSFKLGAKRELPLSDVLVELKEGSTWPFTMCCTRMSFIEKVIVRSHMSQHPCTWDIAVSHWNASRSILRRHFSPAM